MFFQNSLECLLIFLGGETWGGGGAELSYAICISLGDGTNPANFLGFRGSVPLLPHLCQLSVP